MFHRPECQRYKQWKREQAKKLLGPQKVVKRKKRKQPITDCIEEGEEDPVPKAILKIISPKCKKKKKRRRPKGPIRIITKHVSQAELYLNCIKPSIEVRQVLLNPRHTACLQDIPSKVEFATEILEDTRTTFRRKPCSARHHRRVRQKKRPGARKPMKDDEKADQKKGEAEDETEEKPKDETEEEPKDETEEEPKDETKEEPKDETEEEPKDETEEEPKDETKEEPKDETEEKPKDETPSGSKAEKRVKDKRRRRKVGRRKVVRKKKWEEDSECDSICSFDSEVCLAGLKMTTEDKKKMEKYRQQTKDTKKRGKN